MEKQLRSDSDKDAAAEPAPQVDAAAPQQAPTPKKQEAVAAAAQVVMAQLSADAPQKQGDEAKPPIAKQPGFFGKVENILKNSGDAAIKDAEKIAGGTKNLATDVAQHLEVIGGEAVGVAELAGLRYPVKTYEAQVDAGLYRGSRLDDETMAGLKAQGIKGVISLCLEHTDDAVLAAKYGLEALNVKILDNSAPTFAQMMEFINFARAHAPSYVHCEAGKGRTGTAVACYRIAVDGWTAEQAIAEGKTFGLSLVNQIAFVKQFAEMIHGADAPVAAPVEQQTAAPPQ